jgi:hypothetical protein
MNPRAKQFGLGGTLQSWTRLRPESLTERQRTLLRRVYSGRDPRVYSRYGTRQWAAAWPRTRLVVKDPFALLSIPAIAEVTGARPVVLFRHPAALLASYRRMGWSPAVGEMATALAGDGTRAVETPPHEPSSLAAMAWFWSAAYDQVLDDQTVVPGAVLVDHAELTRGGDPALLGLLRECGVDGSALRELGKSRGGSRWGAGRAADRPVLHDFDRTPSEITESWRRTLGETDVSTVEGLTGETWARLRARRLPLPSTSAGGDLEVKGGAQ